MTLLRGRAEVESLTVHCLAARQRVRERQVAAERLKHVLPGPGRRGASSLDHSPCAPGAHAVGDHPVLRPIAAADHVARTADPDPHGAIR